MTTRPTGRRLGRLVALAALITLTVVLLGCGSDDNGSDGETDDSGEFAPNIVTTEDIEAQEEGSPGSGLLEWWKAFQFQDAQSTVDLTSEKVLDDIGENNLEDLIKARGPSLQGLEVLDTTESGDSASVRAGLLTFQPTEEGGELPDEPTTSAPATFAMEREGDQWLFDEPAYLEPMLESFKQAQEAAEEGSSEEQPPEDEEAAAE